MQFFDNKQRPYLFELTAHTASQLKKLGLLDVNKILEPEELDKLRSDIGRYIDVLATLAEDSINKHGITAVDFAKSIGGDELEKSWEVFVEAVINFSPPPIRETLRKVQGLEREARLLVAKKAMAKLDQVTPEQLASAIETTISDASLSGATNLPESSASTPDHTL